jgi:maleylacetate reductase
VSSVRTFSFPGIDRVVHGPGAVARAPRIVAELAKQRVFIVTGRTLAAATPLVRDLEVALGARHVGTFAAMSQHAPRADVDAATAAARDARADLLIGYGGSSVTDATKIIAVQLLDEHEPASAMPQIHIPTTLSSGEYTPAAGMTGDQPGVKTYVVDPRMAPFAIVLDPAVTLATPMELWLATGIKSIDHACEAQWGPRPHPITDTLAREAIRRLVAGLPRTLADPDDLEARADCQIAGWMSMAGISNVQVYLSHTLGHQIGARWDVAHGITSGITLPPVMRFLHDESPAAMPPIAAALGVDVTGMDSHAACAAGAAALGSFVAGLGLPRRLRDVGARRDDFAAVAEATVAAGRATGFGGTTTVEHVAALLDEMW